MEAESHRKNASTARSARDAAWPAPVEVEQSAYERWLQHGINYLERERPSWSYIPGVAQIWESGLGHGVAQEDQWHQKNPVAEEPLELDVDRVDRRVRRGLTGIALLVVATASALAGAVLERFWG